MICRECGEDMKELIVRKGGNYRSRITRYTCPRCGYQQAGESLTEKMENDRLDEEVKDKMESEKEDFKNSID